MKDKYKRREYNGNLKKKERKKKKINKKLKN